MGNMTPAERTRIRQQAADKRKARENKVFYILVIITVAIVAVIALSNVVRDALTLPSEIRDLSLIQDNWLVIDTDSRVSKRYHHPASFDIPAGYSQGDFTKYNDGVARDFYLVADAPEAAVSLLYVDAAPNLTAAEYIQRSIDMHGSALTEGASASLGEPFTATVAGEQAQCLYVVFNTPEGAYGCLLLGFDAPRSVCVTAILSGAYTTPENVQTQEQLLAEAQTLLAGLRIEK